MGRRIPLQGVHPQFTRWISNGERFVVEGRPSGGGVRSYVVGLVGGAPRPITPEGAAFQCMTPDGKWILTDWKDRLTLYPVEQGEARVLPAKLKDLQAPMGWAEDGRAPFVAEYGVPARILRLDMQTGKTTVWKELAPLDPAGVRSVQPVLITPDGRFYVYTYRRVLSDLYLVEGLK